MKIQDQVQNPHPIYGAQTSLPVRGLAENLKGAANLRLVDELPGQEKSTDVKAPPIGG